MSQLYDKEGKPVTQEQIAQRLSENPAYERIGKDVIHGYRVSTLWFRGHTLGPMRNTGAHRPQRLLFETMVFHDHAGAGEEDVVNQERYATVEEAIKGHAAMCAWVRERFKETS